MKVQYNLLYGCHSSHSSPCLAYLGSNAEITYLLLGVAPPGQADSFIVNSSTGMISAVEFALDREVFDEYQLSIQVRRTHFYETISV